MRMGRESISASRRRARRTANTVWIAGARSNVTSELMVGAFHECGVGARLVAPAEVIDLVGPGDTVLARLDVRRTLDGVEDGLSALRWVERHGIRTLNPAPSLLACHDKLATAIRLTRSGIPHPSTGCVDAHNARDGLAFPLVVKPRFGSWGRDVFRCYSEPELRRCLNQVRKRAWFRRQGALVQELVRPRGFDLRLIVACGAVVGAVRRVAPAGEWRTNIALGGVREPVVPTEAASRLAVAAAEAVGGDLVGVDLLPLPNGGHVVLEVNGAVDFTSEYSLGCADVFEAVARCILEERRPDADPGSPSFDQPVGCEIHRFRSSGSGKEDGKCTCY